MICKRDGTLKCPTCIKPMPSAASSCPSCDAPNTIHPTIQKFAQTRLPAGRFEFDHTEAKIWGRSYSLSYGKIFLWTFGLIIALLLAWLLLESSGLIKVGGDIEESLWITIGLSGVSALVLGVAAVLQLLGRLFPRLSKARTFEMDFGQSPPRWISNDDKHWQSIKNFLENPDAPRGDTDEADFSEIKSPEQARLVIRGRTQLALGLGALQAVAGIFVRSPWSAVIGAVLFICALAVRRWESRGAAVFLVLGSAGALAHSGADLFNGAGSVKILLISLLLLMASIRTCQATFSIAKLRTPGQLTAP